MCGIIVFYLRSQFRSALSSMEKKNDDTKILEAYEKGPWPSHVTELRNTTYPLGYYARGVKEKYTPWYSGSFKVKYVFSGILARRTRDGKASEVHFRTYSPSGRFLSTAYMKKIADIADKYGIGLVEFGGNTGAIVINIIPEKADEAVDVIRNYLGSDVGGSGDTFRESYACPGPALCEYACFDTIAAMDYFRSHPEIYRYLNLQMFPYKLKMKFSGCPMDCATSNTRSDFAFIGTWVGAPDVDQDALRSMVNSGKVDPQKLARDCPSGAMTWDSERREMKVDGDKCLKAMNCIKTAFPAIKPGKNRKVALLGGGHAQGHYGPRLSWGYALLDNPEEALPFMVEVIPKYVETAPRRHRMADMIMRNGYRVVGDVVQKTLPDKPKATPSSHPRFTTGIVLTEDEREGLKEWTTGLVQKYEGRRN